ncbi:hypothetical protein OSSY52_21650 [Tepiditoga spiralis]|uniref:Uncharacterized protein n=1 Tax=Tepiditoga spiralis TaxID=2108365 RepID=A0A7G1G9S8_9BACT|nr:hypothetical protein [Tepiditoga spiralis]BBE32024.1 hypothetical protein OSSY52_21650 [Tepiditoga spiralis]
MKIFAGDPINAIEFLNEDINLIFSTSSWSYDQGEVIFIMNKRSINLFNNNKHYLLNKKNREIQISNFKINFGYIEDVLNFNYYFYNQLIKTDLIIFKFEISTLNNLEKIYKHVQSNIRKVHIPVMIFYFYKKKIYISYIVSNNENMFVFKDAIYAYINLEKKEIMYTYGRYKKELKEALINFKSRIYR